MTTLSPDENFYRSLPKKRMGAGCLFFDSVGHILLVEPSYKPRWEIPGGIVELDESPKQCCQREVEEELGLVCEIGRILIVDYTAAVENKTESLMFVFDGGILSDDTIQQIRLQKEELLSYRFFACNALPDAISPTLKQRIQAACQQRDAGDCDVYMETI